MNIGKISDVNFNAGLVNFRLTTKDGRALSEAVREYSETSSEKARMKAFNIFDKHMVQIAKEEAEKGCLFEDYLQTLRLNFLEKLEDCKNKSKRIATDLTTAMRLVTPANEDMRLDNINEGMFVMGKNGRKAAISVFKDIPNEIECREAYEHDVNKISSQLSKQERYVFIKHADGEPYDEILNDINDDEQNGIHTGIVLSDNYHSAMTKLSSIYAKARRNLVDNYKI